LLRLSFLRLPVLRLPPLTAPRRYRARPSRSGQRSLPILLPRYPNCICWAFPPAQCSSPDVSLFLPPKPVPNLAALASVAHLASQSAGADEFTTDELPGASCSNSLEIYSTIPINRPYSSRVGPTTPMLPAGSPPE